MKTPFLILAAAALAAGCAGDARKPEPEREFGSSVRAMVRAQTFNPLAGQAAQPPAGIDGQRAQAALEGYRNGKPLNARQSTDREVQTWSAAEEPAK